MSERSKRVIAVVGATGAQGGRLVRAIHNGQFIARAITRDANVQHAHDVTGILDRVQ